MKHCHYSGSGDGDGDGDGDVDDDGMMIIDAESRHGVFNRAAMPKNTVNPACSRIDE
jgi:hypothetical protein